jgi:hypothetical protein
VSADEVAHLWLDLLAPSTAAADAVVTSASGSQVLLVGWIDARAQAMRGLGLTRS